MNPFETSLDLIKICLMMIGACPFFLSKLRFSLFYEAIMLIVYLISMGLFYKFILLNQLTNSGLIVRENSWRNIRRLRVKPNNCDDPDQTE